MIPAKDSPLFPVWEKANAAGLKFYDCQPCWLDGCNYAQDGGGCKPGVTLNFQLANNMRLGATAYFHTTSFRSSSQIFSAIESMRQSAARVGSSIIGLPLKMVLSPFRTNHNGQAATQYGVSLELRAEDMKALRARFEESAWVPRLQTARRVEELEMVPQLAAPAIAAEFYPEGVYITADFEEESTEEPETQGVGSGQAARATAAKTQDLAQEIGKRQRAPKAETIAPMPEPTPEPVSVTATPAGIQGQPDSRHNPWPDNTRKEFSQYIEPAQYKIILMQHTGKGDESGVTRENYKDLWKALQPFKDATAILLKQREDQGKADLAKRAFGGGEPVPEEPPPSDRLF